MLSVSRCNGENRRTAARAQARIDYGAGREHESEHFRQRLQPVQRFGIDQPKQIAACIQITANLFDFGWLEVSLRRGHHEQRSVRRHLLRQRQIDAVDLEPFLLQLPAELAQIMVGDTVELALTVPLEPQHETRGAANEPHQYVRKRLLAELSELHVFAASAVLDDK